MSDLLPSGPDPSAGDGGNPRVIGVDSEDAADLLAALQSETARDILAALYDDPATPSALAEAVDTSIQNVRYHLEKLTDADLVEVVDTVYSEKAREMKVYAPAAKPLVVFAGSDDEAPGVEAALSRLLGGLGILGVSSLLVQRAFGGSSGDSTYFQGSEGMDATTTAADAGAGASDDAAATTRVEADTSLDGGEPTTASEAADAPRTVTETAPETTRTAGDTATAVADGAGQATTTVTEAAGTATAGPPPGLLFFLGGLVVLAAVGVAWYVRAYR